MDGGKRQLQYQTVRSPSPTPRMSQGENQVQWEDSPIVYYDYFCLNLLCERACAQRLYGVWEGSIVPLPWR